MTGTNLGIQVSTIAADDKLDIFARDDLSITAGVEHLSYSHTLSSGGGGFFGKKTSESPAVSCISKEAGMCGICCEPHIPCA